MKITLSVRPDLESLLHDHLAMQQYLIFCSRMTIVQPRLNCLALIPFYRCFLTGEGASAPFRCLRGYFNRNSTFTSSQILCAANVCPDLPKQQWSVLEHQDLLTLP